MGDSKTFSVNSRIKEIIIETQLREIRLSASDDENYALDYDDRDDLYSTEYSVEDGVIHLHQEFKKRNFLFHPISHVDPIYVKVPTTFDGKVTLVTSNAGIESKIKNLVEEGKFKTTNAGINVNDLKAKKSLSIQTSNATVEVEDLTVKEGTIEVVTTNARIIAKEILGKDLSFTTKNGDCNITDCESIRAFRVTTSNSSINIDHSQAKAFELKTSNARIHVDNAKAERYDVVSSNANVTLLLDGKASEYDFTGITSNGQVEFGNVKVSKELRVPVDSSTKRIAIKTSNASISATFIE
ncbi:MAG: DUF4097 family beta strand repeat-containing protein [Bacilli bacterium]|nr:DUF4097 family beta strand repeat-containing protein [Bacilli bacterium]